MATNKKTPMVGKQGSSYSLGGVAPKSETGPGVAPMSVNAPGPIQSHLRSVALAVPSLVEGGDPGISLNSLVLQLCKIGLEVTGNPFDGSWPAATRHRERAPNKPSTAKTARRGIDEQVAAGDLKV